MENDGGIENLLLLDGSILDQGDGYWVKIEARQLAPNQDIPHGIRYSLTLHNRYGTRLIGYDNAHAVKPPKKFKYAGQKLPYDHRHRSAVDKGVPYLFETAHQMLKDFFKDVDDAMKREKK
ncbi:toxin-antitoxin system TumE family protein [Zhongshania aliphaticivorans]|nr:DUF6516 family protein [Zhongshania aliphaticivorans]AKH67834.1 hypothetical protein IMCC21906_00140 [Spongiibacter sp. IMCC21906]CAA0118080.1 Uncharacterised protein [Zhongshania aliphaticivorans]